eukprot:1500696-Rhodomonas_salina.1
MSRLLKSVADKNTESCKTVALSNPHNHNNEACAKRTLSPLSIEISAVSTVRSKKEFHRDAKRNSGKGMEAKGKHRKQK